MDSIVVLDKMEYAAFVGETETKVTNSNMENTNLRNSDILFKKTQEHRYVEEANEEANAIVNLAENIELDGKIYQIKMSIGSCSTHNSQCLENASNAML